MRLSKPFDYVIGILLTVNIIYSPALWYEFLKQYSQILATSIALLTAFPAIVILTIIVTRMIQKRSLKEPEIGLTIEWSDEK